MIRRMMHALLNDVRFLSFAFYPKTTLIVCVIAAVLIDTGLSFAMGKTQNETVYDILFAIMTGATASFLVSIAVELSNNYNSNKLAWQELRQYYLVILDYENMKQVLMAQTPHQRAKAKAYSEYVAAGGEDKDWFEQPKDLVQATWEQLPEFIPTLKRTLEEKIHFLTDREIEALRDIMFNYVLIRHEIYFRLANLLQYNSLNHPDEDFLNNQYPSNILRDLPDWMRKTIARNESEQAINKVTDHVLADSFLLHEFMRDYEVSKRTVDEYERACESEDNDTDYDEEDLEDQTPEADDDPPDEETFKAQRDEYHRFLEERRKLFAAWNISRSCLDIAENLDVLEKCLLSKPFVGELLKYHRSSPAIKINHGISKSFYEQEKKALERALNKQQNRESTSEH